MLVVLGLGGGVLAFRVAAIHKAPEARTIRLLREPGSSRVESAAIKAEFREIIPEVDALLRVSAQPFTVRLYPNLHAFGLELRKLEGESPQGAWDTAGNVVHGILPLGPGLANARHHLAHIYGEWVFDRLTSTRRRRGCMPGWLR